MSTKGNSAKKWEVRARKRKKTTSDQFEGFRTKVVCHQQAAPTFTSRRESRNLSCRLVSMCSWLPMSFSESSFVLGVLVWSPGANSMSISTSYTEVNNSVSKNIFYVEVSSMYFCFLPTIQNTLLTNLFQVSLFLLLLQVQTCNCLECWSKA